MITLLCIGKNKDKALQALQAEYLKRIRPFDHIECIELKDEPDTNAEREGERMRILEKEGQRVLDKLKPDDFVVLLDLHGQMPDSLRFAENLDAWRTLHRHVVFVIAGSLGPDPRLVKRADVRLKLSDLTFTHLMTRILLLEQIYRAFMILNHRSYHK